MATNKYINNAAQSTPSKVYSETRQNCENEARKYECLS